MSSMDVGQGDCAATYGNQSGCQPMKRVATVFLHALWEVTQRLAIRRSELEFLQLSDCILRDIGVSHGGMDYLADRGRIISRSVYIEQTE
jgi:uncharacterized protein YjiS (DUF1127 family)